MFPDDNHLRGDDRVDNLMKSEILAHFQKLPVPLAMHSQLNLANDLLKHSKLSEDHRFFNLQNVVDCHGMNPLQCITLYLGKLITNSIFDESINIQRHNGKLDEVSREYLLNICESLYFVN